jgi:ABC-type amino acid transport substrate-binding protein
MKTASYKFFLIVVFLLSGCKNDPNVLMVGTSADYPPFEFYQNYEVTGYEIDLVKEIGRRLNLNVQIKDMSFESIIAGIHSGRIDLAISNISTTPERAAMVDFTKPYYTIKTTILVLKDSDIHQVSDLGHKTVGAQFGTIFEATAQNDLMTLAKNLKVRSINRIPDLIQDFKNGRIDALILGKTEADKIQTVMPNLRAIAYETKQGAAAIALKKGSELTIKINKIIDELQNDGTMKTLMKKWKIDS